VHVAVEPARAFEIFTTHVREWWNRAYTASPTKAAIADVVFETTTGGRWYERGVDGSECEWARVLASEPPYRLLVNWHVAGKPTELEVTFSGPAPRRTDVTIVHRGFEAFGDDATRMRDSHDASWRDLLERYAAYLPQHQADGHAETSENANAPAPRAVTDGETVIATIDMATTPERVFRALTTDETETWWGAADTYRAREWKSDLRVGGKWSVDIRLPDDSSFPASGEYLELEAPRRIVQTRRYDWDYPGLGRRDTTVTYLMEPIADGTRVTVRQDGFAGFRESADHHVEGWEGYLKYLAKYVNRNETSA
jgi:uncharacterized protein YndB with AHSA1/START domain